MDSVSAVLKKKYQLKTNNGFKHYFQGLQSCEYQPMRDKHAKEFGNSDIQVGTKSETAE